MADIPSGWKSADSSPFGCSKAALGDPVCSTSASKTVINAGNSWSWHTSEVLPKGFHTVRVGGQPFRVGLPPSQVSQGALLHRDLGRCRATSAGDRVSRPPSIDSASENPLATRRLEWFAVHCAGPRFPQLRPPSEIQVGCSVVARREVVREWGVRSPNCGMGRCICYDLLTSSSHKSHNPGASWRDISLAVPIAG